MLSFACSDGRNIQATRGARRERVIVVTRPRVGAALAGVACLVAIVAPCNEASAQPVPGGVCRPVSERTSEVGCWIMAHESVGPLTDSPTFWYLDTYPTRAAAAAAKGPRGTVVESLGKVWLLTIGPAGSRPAAGERIAQIGPLPIKVGEQYSAQYMEAIFTPGMTTPIHRHGGPEAWYTLAGETCLETPDGKVIGRAGGPPVIVPGGPPMRLTATGTEQRRALVLILHDSSGPPTTIADDWTPKGLCKD
jgi:quercetin dioxygenase-like cupin family protein